MQNLNFIPVVSKDERWQQEKGLVDKNKLEKIITDYNINIKESGFYICGPTIMMKNVKRALKTLNVNKSRIHSERFSL